MDKLQAARNKQIVEMRLSTNYSLEEIGHYFGITRERVRQIVAEYDGEISLDVDNIT